MRTVAIVRWAGRGSIDDLAATVKDVVIPGVGEQGVGTMARMKTTTTPPVEVVGGGDLVMHDVDPIRIARSLRNLPGVLSIAVGYEFASMKELGRVLEVLATRYIKGKNSTFSVSADVGGETSEYSGGDIVLMANSKILSRVQGSKVNEKAPRVRFRVTLIAGRRGSVGVVLWDGAGGIPTSPNRTAYCLVSGGAHSAATAWLAALAGFSIRLVHFAEGDGSLRAVARLYAELSNRMSPRYLSLEVVRGEGSAAAMLEGWLQKKSSVHEDDHVAVLVGLHLECKRSELFVEQLTAAPRGMVFPVAFLREQEIEDMSAKLGTRRKKTIEKEEPDGESHSILFRGPSVRAASKSWTTSSFGGSRADANAVMDSLLSQ